MAIVPTGIATGEAAGTGAVVAKTPRHYRISKTGQIVPPGKKVFIESVLYSPALVNDDVEIAEYAADGSTTQKVIHLKAGSGAASPVSRKYKPPIELNGLNVATLDGGSVDVALAKIEI